MVLKSLYCQYNQVVKYPASDVPKPRVVAEVFLNSCVHGHIAAALLNEMKDHSGAAVLKAFVTQVCCSKCARQGSVEAPILSMTLAKFLLGPLGTEWRFEDLEMHVLVETASMTDGVMEGSLFGCSPVLKKSWRWMLL